MLGKIRSGLGRTRNRIQHAVRQLSGDTTVPEALEALEEILYTADVGPYSQELLEKAETAFADGTLLNPQALQTWLQNELEVVVLDPGDPLLKKQEAGPTVILMTGVNGSGKTTSVAKLVFWLQSRGQSVLVAAGDTFRAAAVEQLSTWCERLNVPLIQGEKNGDPAAVAHDAAVAALSQNVDFLVFDTAGRLHTQKNLMAELDKISRVFNRKIPGAPHHSLLVLDATTGQNAVRQAKLFGECVPLTGVVLSKLDGTAKGGAVLAVGRETRLPVLFVGLGEGVNDWEIFQPKEFIQALLSPRS